MDQKPLSEKDLTDMQQQRLTDKQKEEMAKLQQNAYRPLMTARERIEDIEKTLNLRCDICQQWQMCPSRQMKSILLKNLKRSSRFT